MSSLISRCKKAYKAFLEQEDSTSRTPKQGNAAQASSAKSKEASLSKGLTKKESQEIRNSSNILEELKSIKSSLAKLEKSVPELSRLIKSSHPSPTATGAQGSYTQSHAPQSSQPQPPSPTPSAAPKRSEESVATTTQRKKGWFPAPEQDSNGTYFKELLLNQNRDARFEASVVNGEALFQLSDNITLTTLLSSDVLERVIQYEGVSKEKASKMEIINKGVAIREESDDSWTVKENVLIRLS